MNRHQRRAEKSIDAQPERQMYSAPIGLPAGTTVQCRNMVAGIIKGLGQQPHSDDDIEQRALACFFVLCGELAAMQSERRRGEIIGTFGDAVAGLVANNLAATKQVSSMASSLGRTPDEMVNAAVEDGVAKRVPLPKAPSSH